MDNFFLLPELIPGVPAPVIYPRVSESGGNSGDLPAKHPIMKITLILEIRTKIFQNGKFRFQPPPPADRKSVFT